MSGTPPRPPVPPTQMIMPGFVGGPSTPDVFSNQLRMGVTLTDFTIIFGANEETPMGNVTRDRVAVHLAPGTLKQLLSHLEMAVSAYEEALGPIPAPKRLSEYMAALRANVVRSLQDRINGPSDAEIAAMKSPR